MPDIESFFPEDLKKRAGHVGSELLLSYEDALAAIALATDHEIAVLGFDSGKMSGDGFETLYYSGYDREIALTGTWKEFVNVINGPAENWIRTHPLSEANCGYILTSTSEREFAELDLRKTQ